MGLAQAAHQPKNCQVYIWPVYIHEGATRCINDNEVLTGVDVPGNKVWCGQIQVTCAPLEKE